MEEAYQGSTQSYRADRRARLEEPFDLSKPLSTSWHNLPWPKSDRERMKELLYPPTLEAIVPTTFYLTLPGASVLSLVHLLRTYCSISEQIPQFISLLFIWTRSLGMYELTPMCISLMAIQFLQVRLNQFADDTRI